ncbi:SCO family protein [Candidatus Blastococcus massiliensis]|uniref:SCO family protein n=1 Tax=Candidatus Blastococcus massiliensis TaxID=1470358 RepID=UPI0004BA49C6|nr:SCO family protein [Candidatus Blastococcus massiliensis]
MTPDVLRRARSRPAPARWRAAPAVLLAAGLALAGCGGSSSADDATPSAAGGHDHSGAAPAEVKGPDQVYAGFDLAEPYRKAPFTLTDTTGAPYDFKAETAGRPTLLFFGYTTCPDVCPNTMADVATALRMVDPAIAEQVQVVFVTTDPATDTPEVLGEYLARFDSGLPRPFVGLTGEVAAVEQAQLASGIEVAEDNGRAHSALMLLFGADDAAHVAFDDGNTNRDIAHDLAIVAG